jgi:hypothetical protein
MTAAWTTPIPSTRMRVKKEETLCLRKLADDASNSALISAGPRSFLRECTFAPGSMPPPGPEKKARSSPLRAVASCLFRLRDA